MQVGVTIDGIERVVDRIGGIEERVRHAQPAFEIIADFLEAHVGETFRSQGTRIGQPWSPLAPSTVRARERRWGYYGRRVPMPGARPAGPPLLWSGRLMRSFRRGGIAHVRQVTDRFLVWGSGVKYGPPHQRGGRVPKRVLLGFRDAFQLREIAFQPLRLWVQGVPVGSIKTVLSARLGLALP
jgi:phage gpG-like protein